MRIIDYIIIASCFITALAFGYVLTKDKYNCRNINSTTSNKDRRDENVLLWVVLLIIAILIYGGVFWW